MYFLYWFWENTQNKLSCTVLTQITSFCHFTHQYFAVMFLMYIYHSFPLLHSLACHEFFFSFFKRKGLTSTFLVLVLGKYTLNKLLHTVLTQHTFSLSIYSPMFCKIYVTTFFNANLFFRCIPWFQEIVSVFLTVLFYLWWTRREKATAEKHRTSDGPCIESVQVVWMAKLKYFNLGVPKIWKEPQNHSDDYYFCSYNIEGYSLENRKDIIYPEVKFSLLPELTFSNLCLQER